MAVQPPVCNFGWQAPEFELPAIDGRTYGLADLAGPKGLLVMFICNHCPYVRSIIDRIVRDTHALQARGLGVAAIMSNDWSEYPDDAPDKMADFSREHGFSFPYLIDESQQVAKTYDAICTPDFFGFNNKMELQYRGRLDASRKAAADTNVRRDLYEAMLQIVETGEGPSDQIPSMGCSIKWREAA